MPSPAADLVRPCLEAIVEAAAGRKYNNLRHDARVSAVGVGWAVVGVLWATTVQPHPTPPSPPSSQSLLLELDDVLRHIVPGSEDAEPSAPPPAPPATAAASAGGVTPPRPSTPDTGDEPPPPPADDALRVTADFSGDGGGGEVAVCEGGQVTAAPATAADAAGDADAAGADAANEPFVGTVPSAGAARLLAVLTAAASTKRPPLATPALDAAARLVAHGVVGGGVHTVSSRAGPMPPHAAAIALLAKADDVAAGDDGAALAALRGLVAAAASPSLHLHGSARLLALRAAYSVALVARSDAAAAAARASLLQITVTTFSRLEARSRTARPATCRAAPARRRRRPGGGGGGRLHCCVGRVLCGGRDRGRVAGRCCRRGGSGCGRDARWCVWAHRLGRWRWWRLSVLLPHVRCGGW